MSHPEPSTAEPASDQREAGRPERQKWVWGMTGALAVVVLGAAGAVVAIDAQSNNRADVRAVAEEYIGAVAAGDAEAAERLFDGRTSPGTESVPDADAFAEASHIVDAELGRFRVDFDAGRASGDVSYALDGYPYTERIELRRTEDDAWRVTAGLRHDVPLDTTGGGALGLQGADAPLPEDAQSITLYSSEYSLVSHNPFFEAADEARFTVTSDGDALYTSDWLVPGTGYAEEVQRAVASAYEECADLAEVWELQSCGIDAPEPSAEFDSIAPVTVTIEMTDPPMVSGSDAASMWMQIEERGSFAATYSGRDADGRALTEEVEVRASAADVEVMPTVDGLDVEIYPY
ncbi:hypothetical protein PQI23_07085 [Leucobacter sp. USCH14]|uniref:hypothetical protein n=1 Tax=Leucobacter sp. USCH14 TaxID=3024838 RepID=UPI0030949A41